MDGEGAEEKRLIILVYLRNGTLHSGHLIYRVMDTFRKKGGYKKSQRKLIETLDRESSSANFQVNL